MPYLTKDTEIRAVITKLTSAKTLWVDTEVADYNTRKPRLSLIQVLAEPKDLTGEGVYLLDVLEKVDVVTFFVNQIMEDTGIEKVFHNASYDLRFLGRERAKNVTCTWNLARKIPSHILAVPNLKLKTLAEKLCQFPDVDKAEQGSDWGRRPLTAKQLHYAKMDPVYLAHVHLRLLELANQGHSNTISKTFDVMVKFLQEDDWNLEKAAPVAVPPLEYKVESFSVTDVRVAFECPRLFYLGYRFGGMTMFLPSGNCSGIGKSFHQLSEQFILLAQQDSHFQSLLEPPSQIQVEAIAAQMQQLFYERIFFPHLQQVSKQDPGKTPALLQLWQGLTGVIRRWAELLVKNRSYCAAREVFSQTFIAQELSVKHYFNLANGTQQLVQGRFDSLVYDFEQRRLCVVEYKTYQSVDPSAQLAQLALYSYMLREKVGLPLNSAVYCVLPELQELTFSWEKLETTVHQIIPQKLQQMQQWLNWHQFNPNPPPPTAQPELCQICPQQTKCQTFFTATDSQQTVPHQPAVSQIEGHEGTLRLILPEDIDIPHKDTTDTDAKTLGEKLVTALQHFGIGTEYQAAVIGPAFIRVKLKPNLGVKVGSITKLSDDLRVQLGLECPPLIAPQAGYVSVDLPRPDRQIARFEQYVQRESPHLGSIRIAIGVNMDGNLVEADLSDPNTCHFLVGGTTGSGKSEFLRSLVLSLLVRHAKTLQIVLIDPKRVTFPDFEQLPWLYTPVIKEDTEAIDLMTQLVQEMQQRYQQFEQAGCTDINTYNQKMNFQKGQLLPRIVCIFDEYADFMNEKEIRNALEQSIKRLGAMARAAGIHLIIATQRPEAKVVTPLIRSNLPGRVALRTASEADSKLILGNTQMNAAYLLGKGDLLYQSGAQLLRLQSLLTIGIKLPKYT
jgi:S-DNA-T family DNA segregation ATPase FtsK/SpoIIIE